MASDSADRSGPPPEGGGTGEAKPRDEWEWWWKRLFGVMVLLILLVTVGNPLASGKVGREKARPFVEKLYPDRPVTPPESVTAYVAVVFNLIRSGSPDVARQAIDFAAENHFAYAGPYVIERLEDEDPELRKAARAFLVGVALEDHGPSPEAWRAWWRNPPHTVLGCIGVGYTTVVWATPVLTALAAFVLWGVGRLRGRVPGLSWGVAWGVFAPGWFMLFFALGLRLVGGPEECTFGEERIAYHVSHGVVLGLEDARAGGGGLFLILAAGFVLVPALMAGLGWFLFSRGRSRHGPPGETG